MREEILRFEFIDLLRFYFVRRLLIINNSYRYWNYWNENKIKYKSFFLRVINTHLLQHEERKYKQRNVNVRIILKTKKICYKSKTQNPIKKKKKRHLITKYMHTNKFFVTTLYNYLGSLFGKKKKKDLRNGFFCFWGRIQSMELGHGPTFTFVVYYYRKYCYLVWSVLPLFACTWTKTRAHTRLSPGYRGSKEQPLRRFFQSRYAREIERYRMSRVYYTDPYFS